MNGNENLKVWVEQNDKGYTTLLEKIGSAQQENDITKLNEAVQIIEAALSSKQYNLEDQQESFKVLCTKIGKADWTPQSRDPDPGVSGAMGEARRELEMVYRRVEQTKAELAAFQGLKLKAAEVKELLKASFFEFLNNLVDAKNPALGELGLQLRNWAVSTSVELSQLDSQKEKMRVELVNLQQGLATVQAELASLKQQLANMAKAAPAAEPEDLSAPPVGQFDQQNIPLIPTEVNRDNVTQTPNVDEPQPQHESESTGIGGIMGVIDRFKDRHPGFFGKKGSGTLSTPPPITPLVTPPPVGTPTQSGHDASQSAHGVVAPPLLPTEAPQTPVQVETDNQRKSRLEAERKAEIDALKTQIFTKLGKTKDDAKKAFGTSLSSDKTLAQMYDSSKNILATADFITSNNNRLNDVLFLLNLPNPRKENLELIIKVLDNIKSIQ